MNGRISVCITLKNRAHFLKDKLEELLDMDYDPKLLEVCVTDGGSQDGLIDVLKTYQKEFGQIKYAFSDRNELPFTIPENNPACDINAQICNVATFEKIVRTDAEVRFLNKKSLQYVNEQLEEDCEVCIAFHSLHMGPDYKEGDKISENHIAYARMSFHCSCFTKTAFIQNGGVEEKFALGFAAEDSYFHQWWNKNRKLIHPPNDMKVIHLWHGPWQTPNRLRLKHQYTLPLYKRYLKENHTPNEGNPDWKRPEMIKDVQIWN